MFRNSYIQNYKNSIKESSTIEVMLCHVNHIYAALGCVIQDIEFMVGNMMSAHQQKISKQRQSMPVGKIENMPFVAPKIEFLPSSSYKYDNYQPIIENVRKQPQKNRHSQKKNNSFDQMFPQPRHQSKLPPPKKPVQKHKPPQDSQQDFMDYLFNKRKS